MLKTLLVFCGVLVVSATGLQAQQARSFGGGGAARGAAFTAARPAAYRGGFANHYGGGYRGGYHHHGGNWGRYYYLGGIPYFYPFGYPYYYGGFYGDGFGYGFGYGGYPYGYGGYDARAVNNGSDAAEGNGDQPTGGSLPEAVQKQLAKRGYYKGTVDGKFGPESRSALSRFQKKQGLKETGRIDEETLQALGFTDRQ